MDKTSQQFNPVVWFEIYTNDLQRARKFYEAVLDVTLEPLGDPTEMHMQMLQFPNSPQRFGAGGTLCHMEGISGGMGGTLIYFGCEDCGVEAGRIEAAGGKLFKPKFSIGEFGHAALGIDTEGNLFGLHSMA